MATSSPPAVGQADPADQSLRGTPWEPLPAEQFDAEAARHLLRRTGWSAIETEVERAVAEGLPSTIARLFPSTAPAFPPSPELLRIQEIEVEMAEQIRAAPEAEKRKLRREARERFQRGYQDLTFSWLRHAKEPANAAPEKWLLFLWDIYVVGFDKVRNPTLIWRHLEILRTHGFGPAPSLAKAVSRSPAMIEYLDVDDSKRTAPNENFARELFELFVLGEGNYTERDIKEAARAFTGYRRRFGEFRFIRNQHDSGAKTVFGQTGAFSGDDIIDLAYRQPAAATFLPQQLWRFYVSDQPMPAELARALGAWWRNTGFDLRKLQQRVFGSRAFFEAAHRGNYIKSPLQFYLGLLQDLNLSPAPLPRQVIGVLRQMGQMPFNPPNVRGWVHGKNWINSTTLAARRQLVNALLAPLPTATLNADDLAALEAARRAGDVRFTASGSDLPWWDKLAGENDIESVLGRLLPAPHSIHYAPVIKQQLQELGRERAREVLAAVLQAPGYQLC